MGAGGCRVDEFVFVGAECVWRTVCGWRAGGVQEEVVLWRRAVSVLLMKCVEGVR